MIDEVATCPFCAGTPLAPQLRVAGYSVACSECGARGPSRENVRDAWAAWNTILHRSMGVEHHPAPFDGGT